MQKFSRICVFVYLGVAFLFVSVTVDVHAQASLEVIEGPGADRVYAVGDTVEVVFQATLDAVPLPGAELIITYSGVINVTITNGGTTDVLGRVAVKGTVVEPRCYIQAIWPGPDKQVTIRFEGEEPGHAPVIIVVNPPDPNTELKIGDTFTQTISIENPDSRWSTLPLSAWQMDVVFDPLTLEVVGVTEGDFLESDGEDVFFVVEISSGKISVTQNRTRQIVNADLTFPDVVKAPFLLDGIPLGPGERGTLLTIAFKVLAVADEPLGLHNVRLLSDLDYDRDRAPDRIAYSILISDVHRVSTTHQSSAMSAQAVFREYRDIFQHPDIHEHFPDVLRAFKNPEVQNILNSVVINHFVGNPRFIREFYPETDDSILVLLLFDDEFQALFRDEQFHAVLQDPNEIDKLVRLISQTTLHPRGDPTCPLPPQPDPSTPTTLSIVSGRDQSGEIGKPLAQLFVVGVLDQKGKPLQGTTVTFTLTQGDGRLSVISQTTDVYGQARTTLTLGPRAGSHSVTARADGIPQTQTFTATAIELSRRLTLNIVSGNGQSGEVGKSLARPFVVSVLDQDGKPRQGVQVTFTVEGSGRLSGRTERTIDTDENGEARTTLTLSSHAGSHSVTARAAGITQTQTFTAIAIAPPPPPEPPAIPPTAESPLPPMYWIEGNTIYYRPTGDQKTLFITPRDGNLTGGLAVDTVYGKVYWTERKEDGMGRVRSANLDGSTVQTVKEIFAVPLNITVGTDKSDKRWVYWTTFRNKIQRINVDGSGFDGNFMEFPSSPTPPNHIAFDQKSFRLYWTEQGRIRGVASNGTGKRDTIVADLGELGGIAVADGAIYWTEQTENGFGSVRSMNRAGSGAKLLAVTESIPAGVAVDPVGGRVYWTTSRGDIQSASLTGDIQTLVMHGTGPAIGIALGGATQVSGAPAAPSISPVVSVENTLLANYPNPFNPETWIPYQLSEPADVSVSIYSVNGHLVRRLELGHQSAGVYQSRSRAAYWDGRNAFGEQVASGLYFYTLTAGDFTATRKMLIRK